MISSVSRCSHPRTWIGLLRKATLSTKAQHTVSNNVGGWDSRKSPPSSSSPLNGIPLSRVLSQYATDMAVSRRTAESLIREGHVTIAGQIIESPHHLVDPDELGDSSRRVIKVQGKAIKIDLTQKDNQPMVYAAHKLSGEMVTERDPHGRPSLIERLQRGGVGRLGKKQQFHIKPIGRLDMPTEGLILLTNDGEYAREMELPRNQIHRVYRARIYGELTPFKLDRIRRGGIRSKDGIRYGPMQISIERNTSRGVNTWVQLTTSEGKNRMIRNLFSAVGATVTRLIRIQYGDYTLQTIPPGMAIEVPYKPIQSQKAKGPITPQQQQQQKRQPLQQKPQGGTVRTTERNSVKWVRSIQ